MPIGRGATPQCIHKCARSATDASVEFRALDQINLAALLDNGLAPPDVYAATTEADASVGVSVGDATVARHETVGKGGC
jgi:hypothetical protein